MFVASQNCSDEHSTHAVINAKTVNAGFMTGSHIPVHGIPVSDEP